MKKAGVDGKHGWPPTLPDQFRLVRAVLASQRGLVDAAALAARFRRVRRDRLAAVLDTLVSLDQARRTGEDRYVS